MLATMSRHPRVRHVHASGRFDRSPASLLRATLTYLRRPRSPRKNLITYTEVVGPRRTYLRRMLPHWKVLGRKGDATMAVARWRWVVEEVSYLHGTDQIRRPVWFLIVDLRRRRTGERVTVVAGHLPAHHDRPNYLKGWSECMRALSALWKDRTQPLVIAADWNKDWRQEETRRQFRKVFPGCNCTWDGHLPENGTHGRRLIDFTITDLPVKRRHLYAANSSSDHTAYAEVLVAPHNGG